MASAVAAAKLWRSVPAPKRGEAVRLMGEELRQYKSELGSLVSLEMGKIKAEGDGEVQEMIDIADFAVGQSRMLYGVQMHSERPNHRMFEQWHPLGVVGVISAFNFPVAVWSWNAFLAAICGNVTVWKPSPKTALCAVAVQHICNRVLERNGLPPIFQLFIDEGTELAIRFVEDRRVDLVSFTGSTAVGRDVGQRVAKRLGKSLLELGGNNAIIVDEYANLDLVVPAIVFGAVGTAGQRCTTTRRVFVHESQMPELERRLTHAYKQVPHRRPARAGHADGTADRRRLGRALSKQPCTGGRAHGGRLLCGGKRLDRPGFFVEPAIVVARGEWDIVRTETFAPMLYLIPFKTLDEAIEAQNAVAHGLSSAIFTDRLQHAERFLSAGRLATAASPTSTSARQAPRSAARSAARRTRAAAASPAPTPGRPTCAGRRARSTGARRCRWRRASTSTWVERQRPARFGARSRYTLRTNSSRATRLPGAVETSIELGGGPGGEQVFEA